MNDLSKLHASKIINLLTKCPGMIFSSSDHLPHRLQSFLLALSWALGDEEDNTKKDEIHEIWKFLSTIEKEISMKLCNSPHRSAWLDILMKKYNNDESMVYQKAIEVIKSCAIERNIVDPNIVNPIE